MKAQKLNQKLEYSFSPKCFLFAKQNTYLCIQITLSYMASGWRRKALGVVTATLDLGIAGKVALW